MGIPQHRTYSRSRYSLQSDSLGTRRRLVDIARAGLAGLLLCAAASWTASAQDADQADTPPPVDTEQPAAPESPPPDDILEVVGTPTLNLALAEPPSQPVVRNVPVRITAPDVDLDTVNFVTRRVRRDDQDIDVATIAVDLNQDELRLVLTMQPAAIFPPGTYTVDIDVMLADVAQPVDTVTLTVERPAPLPDNVLDVVGESGLQLELAAPPDAPVVRSIPVRIVATGIDLDSLEFLTRRVQRDNQEIDHATVVLALDQDTQALSVTMQADAIVPAGVYTVDVDVNLPGAAKPVDTLSLKIVRPAAVLELTDPLKIEYISAVLEDDEMSADRIVYAETGGKSYFSPVQTELSVALVSGDTHPVDAVLKVTFPNVTAPHHQGNATLAVENDLEVGTVGGRIVVRSDLLAQDITIPVEITTRLDFLWLILAIGFGVLLGLIVRWLLNKMRVRNEAMIPAHLLEAKLDRIISSTVDKEIIDRLQAVREELTRNINSVLASTDSIATAKTAAENALNEILEEAKERQKTMNEALSAWDAALHTPGSWPPAVAELLRNLQTELDQQRSLLATGVLGSVEAFNTSLAKQRIPAIRDAATAWADQARLWLQQAKPWPEIKVGGAEWATSVADIIARIGAFEDAAKDVKDATKFTTMLSALARLWRDVDYRLRQHAGLSIHAAASTVLRELEGQSGTADTKPVEKLRDAIEALGDNVSETGAPGTQKLIENLNGLWIALSEALEAAGIVAGHAGADDLEQGKFLAALETLTPPVQQAPELLQLQSLLAGRFSLTSLGLPALRLPVGEPEPEDKEAEASWSIRLDVADFAYKDVPIEIEAVLDPATDEVPSGFKLQWVVDGRPQFPDEGGLTFTYTPNRLGRVPVRAVAYTVADPKPRVADHDLQVLPPQGYLAAVARQKSVRWITLVQTLVAAAFVILGGFAIFRPSFAGTFDDFMAAVLWGFSVDITLSKVLEWADPLKTLKPSFPKVVT